FRHTSQSNQRRVPNVSINSRVFRSHLTQIFSRNSYTASQFSIARFLQTRASKNYWTPRAENDLQMAGLCDALLQDRLNEICRDLHRPHRDSLLSIRDIRASAVRHAGRVDFGGGMADRVTPTGAVTDDKILLLYELLIMNI